jgi:TatD DNase family protein
VRFVDSHLHIEGNDVASLFAFPPDNGNLLVVCGTDRATSEAALRLAGTYPELVEAFVGVHPSEGPTIQDLIWVEKALERAAGAGEIGLDPKYSPTGPGSAQRTAFLAQLESAQALKKPVQVHSRNAERECLEVLGGFTLKAVLMHWFQDEVTLQEVLGEGYFLSFGPSLLYSKKLQRMAAKCDPSQVLCESDSPVAYAPLGGVHGSFLVPSVVFKLAEVWKKRFEDARETIVENSRRYLGFLEKG